MRIRSRRMARLSSGAMMAGSGGTPGLGICIKFEVCGVIKNSVGCVGGIGLE